MLTALAWAYTLRGGAMAGMPGAADMAASPGMAADLHAAMGMPTDAPAAPIGVTGLVQPADLILFLFGWGVMMVAMMLPAALPLILLYRMSARKRLSPGQATTGMVFLVAGYVAVWTVVGLPVYGYNRLAAAWGPTLAVLPGLLLVAGGIYQFTGLKHRCHTRCSSPIAFLLQQWRPGASGAARMGVQHGIDCLGCCLGLMLALVALGMMNVAWMLTAAILIFVEKTVPGGHWVARPLGTALVVGGVFVITMSLLGDRMAL
jgi:predicted metal-binding membrane protein